MSNGQAYRGHGERQWATTPDMCCQGLMHLSRQDASRGITARVLPGARGRVLEIGFGSGLDLPTTARPSRRSSASSPPPACSLWRQNLAVQYPPPHGCAKAVRTRGRVSLRLRLIISIGLGLLATDATNALNVVTAIRGDVHYGFFWSVSSSQHGRVFSLKSMLS